MASLRGAAKGSHPSFFSRPVPSGISCPAGTNLSARYSNQPKPPAPSINFATVGQEIRSILAFSLHPTAISPNTRSMNQIIDVILVAILLLAGLVMAGIAAIDSFLSDAMTYAGVPALSQIIILFALVFWLIAMAVRSSARSSRCCSFSCSCTGFFPTSNPPPRRPARSRSFITRSSEASGRFERDVAAGFIGIAAAFEIQVGAISSRRSARTGSETLHRLTAARS